MHSLTLEITLATPDGNPWPLLNAFDEEPDLGLQIVIADGVRVPALGQRLDAVVARFFRIWRNWGALAAREFMEAAVATQIPPRRR